MERLTYRDAEGHARWRKELLEDNTGAAGELIRNTVAEYDDTLNADVVPVVRCRECKHYKPQSKSVKWNCTTLYCNRSATVKMDPDDFCSKGEKR